MLILKNSLNLSHIQTGNVQTKNTEAIISITTGLSARYLNNVR